MDSSINNSFQNIKPEEVGLYLGTLDVIDNKVKGTLLRSLGMAVKINTGTPRGKIYVHTEGVKTYLDARGETSALFASREELEKMMKRVIEGSQAQNRHDNILTFYKPGLRYFQGELINQQCGISYGDGSSENHSISSKLSSKRYQQE